MEALLILLLFVFMFVFVGLGRTPQEEREALSSEDHVAEFAALAKRLGLSGSSLSGTEWAAAGELEGHPMHVRVQFDRGRATAAEWLVARLSVTVSATLPGEVTVGSRAMGRREPDANALVSPDFDAAYWADGAPAEVLAALPAGLSRALVDADRAAPRWTRVAMGESAVFERIPQSEYRLEDLEADMPALTRLAAACVARFPRGRALPGPLLARVRDDGEPLLMRLLCAHALLTEFGGSGAAGKLVEGLDALPDPLYVTCALWAPDAEGDPADLEGAFVELLASTLEPAGAAALFPRLKGAGWEPSTRALFTLEAAGLDVARELSARRAEGAGKLSLMEGPEAGGLSPAKGAPGGITEAPGEG